MELVPIIPRFLCLSRGYLVPKTQDSKPEGQTLSQSLSTFNNVWRCNVWLYGMALLWVSFPTVPISYSLWHIDYQR